LDTPTPSGPWYVILPPEAAPYAGRCLGPFATEDDARAWLKCVPFIRRAAVRQFPGGADEPGREAAA
jgi:hypothetical protein